MLVTSEPMFINPMTNQLVLCDHGNRCIAVLNLKNWTKSIIVKMYEGKKLNSPNDIIINSKGHYYFTDPPYGLTWPDFAGKELEYSGVYHLLPDGEMLLVTKELNTPKKKYGLTGSRLRNIAIKSDFVKLEIHSREGDPKKTMNKCPVCYSKEIRRLYIVTHKLKEICFKCDYDPEESQKKLDDF